MQRACAGAEMPRTIFLTYKANEQDRVKQHDTKTAVKHLP